MGLVIFLLSLSSHVLGCSTKRCICGIPNDFYEPFTPSQHNRVGRITVTNEYPWNIFIYKRGQFVCGGSLIDTSHVLTAAHCVAKGTTANDIAVYAYSGLPDEDSFSWTVHHRVSKIHFHPDRMEWNETDDWPWNSVDMALLELEVPVKYSATVKPTCLPAQPANTFIDKMARFTGWANLRKKGLPVLLEVTMKIVDCSPWDDIKFVYILCMCMTKKIFEMIFL